MTRLNRFYGNPDKVVACINYEVVGTKAICDCDYKSLLFYCVVMENNYNLLMAIGRKYELSNVTSKSSILAKVPFSMSKMCQQSLTLKSNEEKTKPFPVFIDWLKSQKETWEQIAAASSSRNEVIVKTKERNFFDGGGTGGDSTE